MVEKGDRMDTKVDLIKLKEELKELETEKYSIHVESVKLKNFESELFHFLEEKDQLFHKLFEFWKHGEMKSYIDQIYSEIKSTEKNVLSNLEEKKELIKKQRTELEFREEELRYEILKLEDFKE